MPHTFENICRNKGLRKSRYSTPHRKIFKMAADKISYRGTVLTESSHIATDSEDFVKNVLRKWYNRFSLYILTKMVLLDQ